MGLGLTNFALEGGVSGRTSLKIEGKGNSEMTLLSAYITLRTLKPLNIKIDQEFCRRKPL